MRRASVSGNSRLKQSRIQRWQKSSWRPSSPSLVRCWWKRGSMRRSSSRRYIWEVREGTHCITNIFWYFSILRLELGFSGLHVSERTQMSFGHIHVYLLHDGFTRQQCHISFIHSTWLYTWKVVEKVVSRMKKPRLFSHFRTVDQSWREVGERYRNGRSQPPKRCIWGGGVSSLLTIRQAHTETSYQLPLHVLIARWADEDGVLHEADKAPEGVAFILDLSEQGGHQVRHALAVAHVWIKHCIVEQNPPAETTDVLVLL